MSIITHTYSYVTFCSLWTPHATYIIYFAFIDDTKAPKYASRDLGWVILWGSPVIESIRRRGQTISDCVFKNYTSNGHIAMLLFRHSNNIWTVFDLIEHAFRASQRSVSWTCFSQGPLTHFKSLMTLWPTYPWWSLKRKVRSGDAEGHGVFSASGHARGH